MRYRRRRVGRSFRRRGRAGRSRRRGGPLRIGYRF